MAKAPCQSTARIPLGKAPELAAKRLGVDDLDYAKIRLCEILQKAKFGRDWGVQAVHPSDTRVEDMWRKNVGWWRVNWDTSRADELGVFSEMGEPLKTVLAGPFAVGLWIAPAVIAALSPTEAAGDAAGASGPPRGATERWVYNQMEAKPPKKGDHEYVGNLHELCPHGVSKKRIANIVGRYRKQFEIPTKTSREAPAKVSYR